MTCDCQIVIGADGTEAQSTRWAGLKSIPQLKDYYSAAQYLLTDVNIESHGLPVSHRLVAGAGAAMCGSFRKATEHANVGLVIAVDPKANPIGHRLPQRLCRASVFRGSSILSQVVGGIPISNVLPEMTADGYLAVGDAAHQSDPLTAGGITNGMYGGLFAAQTAIEALQAGRHFAQVPEEVREDVGRQNSAQTYRRLYRMRHAVFKIPEEKLNSMIRAGGAAAIAQDLSLDADSSRSS